jgi:hypothetical protein
MCVCDSDVVRLGSLERVRDLMVRVAILSDSRVRELDICADTVQSGSYLLIVL